ncbi:hypothetical protein SAMN05428983_0562 [Agrobacterium fabrum]|uniref:Uncharacterized protein n=1 Tax=Agrobacterium fabrum TaxID=1176649 RepID=A0A7Z7BGK8_9HYPH|nr:hypothetical protein [Agrobacterium fabrum]SDJ19129.1 hypothetical protein SAMN05428983_0562 [Agrobacterium fabrum]
MKLGVFKDGFPTAFYDRDLHGKNIPPDAIEITDKQWLELINNQGMRRFIDGQVVEYTPPVEPVPPPPITKRQLRLTLVRNGISLASVDAAIASMPDGLAKEEAQIEWADASSFNRNHPTLLLIAAALGLTEAQVDAMWAEAVTA